MVKWKETNLPVYNFFVLIDFDYHGFCSLVVANLNRDKLFFKDYNESCDSKNTQNQKVTMVNLLDSAWPIATESFSTHQDRSWNEL